eukprot:scaffold18121_cov117-Isochrysis_galbana.AAC.4
MIRTPREAGKAEARIGRSAAAIWPKERFAVSVPGKPPPRSRRSMGRPMSAASLKTWSARLTADTYAWAE